MNQITESHTTILMSTQGQDLKFPNSSRPTMGEMLNQESGFNEVTTNQTTDGKQGSPITETKHGQEKMIELLEQILVELKRAKATRKLSLDYEEGFEEFWKAYPKKKAKPFAFKAWKNIKDINIKKDFILQAVELHKTSIDWNKDGGMFIPFPQKWLNEHRWLDTVTINTNF